MCARCAAINPIPLRAVANTVVYASRRRGRSGSIKRRRISYSNSVRRGVAYRLCIDALPFRCLIIDDVLSPFTGIVISIVVIVRSIGILRIDASWQLRWSHQPASLRGSTAVDRVSTRVPFIHVSIDYGYVVQLSHARALRCWRIDAHVDLASSLWGVVREGVDEDVLAWPRGPLLLVIDEDGSASSPS